MNGVAAPDAVRGGVLHEVTRQLVGVALVASADTALAGPLMADLAVIGYAPIAVSLSDVPDPTASAAVLLVAPSGGATEAVRFSQAVRRSGRFARTPIVWVVREEEGDLLRTFEELYDDFVEVPYTRAGLEARLRQVRRRAGQGDSEVLQRGTLALNLSTYQASVGGRSLDLTFMEYQLLRFLATHPNRVYTREAILRQVWGYDYYGGIRTVDVHIRRLRAKLGQHAYMIQTVRSVGYRFVEEPTAAV